MLRTEVGVDECRLEAHERFHVAEESLRLCPLVNVHQGQHAPFEFRALVVVGLDPVVALHRKRGRIERMECFEECADAVAVLVDERPATDQAVADEQRFARDVLERGHVHRERRSERRQQRDLELERLLDGRASRKAEHPVVVDDRYLKVVPVVDLQNLPRTAPERVCDQPLAVRSHTRMVSDAT